MESKLQSAEVRTMTKEIQAAEAIFVMQSEDHTRPAEQVFGEQRESAARGLVAMVFVP